MFVCGKISHCIGCNHEFSDTLSDIDAEFADCEYLIEVAPVVHGGWVASEQYKPWLVCSKCKDYYVDGDWIARHKWSYCPNCGAKMDGQERMN